MRNGCVIAGLVILCFVREVCNLQCYHCGWSRERRNYRKQTEEEEELPYPVAERHMARNDAEQAELSNPPAKDQLEKYCRKQTCSVRNDACVTWSFKSNHPINMTYMCVGNPKKLSGCYRQKLENKDFLEIEVCLCGKDFCNDARIASAVKILTLMLAALLAFDLL